MLLVCGCHCYSLRCLHLCMWLNILKGKLKGIKHFLAQKNEFVFIVNSDMHAEVRYTKVWYILSINPRASGANHKWESWALTALIYQLGQTLRILANAVYFFRCENNLRLSVREWSWTMLVLRMYSWCENKSICWILVRITRRCNWAWTSLMIHVINFTVIRIKKSVRWFIEIEEAAFIRKSKCCLVVKSRDARDLHGINFE